MLLGAARNVVKVKLMRSTYIVEIETVLFCNILAMEKVSKKGRTFVNGKCLGNDLRNLIIDDCLTGGGDPETQYFPGKFNVIADKFKVSNSTARKQWDLFCSNKNTVLVHEEEETQVI